MPLSKTKGFIWKMLPYPLRSIYGVTKSLASESLAYGAVQKRFPDAHFRYPCWIEPRVLGSCHFGKETMIGPRITILYGNVSVGDYSLIVGPGEMHAEKNPIRIGKFCAIASDIYINTSDHPLSFAATTNPFIYIERSYESGREFLDTLPSAPISIGNDVWIGNGAKILKGVSIGDGAVVGAGAVVTRDVEPYSVVGGVPARMIKKRFKQDTIDALMKIRWWDWPAKKIIRNRRFFNTDLARLDGDIESIISD